MDVLIIELRFSLNIFYAFLLLLPVKTDCCVEKRYMTFVLWFILFPYDENLLYGIFSSAAWILHSIYVYEVNMEDSSPKYLKAE